MLPRVRELESRLGDGLVAIGVHAGKYPAERATENIAEACLRLGVEHPVVNDRQFRIWRSYAVRAWPTLAILDPRGYVVASEAGELPLAGLEEFLRGLIERHAAAGTLARDPFELGRPSPPAPPGGLRFPGKLLAAGDRLYVSDTGHHQIVELELARGASAARVVRRFGLGQAGFQDGSAASAHFREPQGLALDTDALYVADRANHAVRRIALNSGRVTTVAGTGELGSRPRPGPPLETALRSPWDLDLHERTLFIAMAGSHQLWRLDFESGHLRVHAGTGAESIEDGPLAQATLAQPSGLALGDGRLYFADAESSSIRWADLAVDGRVGTIVGIGLFDHGDRDGRGDEVRLQHPLGVAWREDALFVADTYNGKLKRVDPAARTCVTLPEQQASGLREPGGLAVGGDYLYVADTGNHRIVRVSLKSGAFEALELPEG